MKTCLNVVIISNNKDYETLFKSIEFSQDVSFLTTNLLNEKDLNSASIIIYDNIINNDYFNGYSINICILDQSKYDETLDYSYYNDLWLLPMNHSLLKFKFIKLLEQALLKKKSEIYDIYLNTLINSVPDLIWFKDLKGAHLKVNDAFGKAVGKSKEQCEGRGHYYIWDLEPDEYANGEYVCLETEEEVIKLGKTCLFDEKVKAKNGLRQFKTYKSPLYDYLGNMLGTVGIAKDVTDLHNVSRELEVILSSVPFASLIVDENNHLVYANQVFYNIFNIKVSDDHSLSYSEFYKNILKLNSTQLNSNEEIIVSLKNRDKLKYLNVQQQSIKDIFGNHFGYFLICIDITKEKELQNKILHHANTDFLTGLYNRRYFYKVVHKINTSDKIAFVYFDLDYFKTINDTYGHQIGDEALKMMATLLRNEFTNDLIVRLGGDEFLIAINIINNVDEIIPKVENFITLTKNTFLKSEQFKVLSVSVGISFANQEFDTDQLLLEADKALYKAKSLGRGIACIYSNKED